ncbi:hypothetical protein [Nocardia cyriacigeorgica]|uniref:hypothetical protein n=1 Tax=Nocardia cyriacigeorgica TaxID=135487 RepID=UPI00245720CA|nr:hypothetical protein [Nocardia cyriacigeorgica]
MGVLVVGESAVGKPVVGEPAVGELGAGVPAVGDPAVGEPAVDEPVVGESAVGELGAGVPAVGDPAVGEPAVGEPAVGDPVVGAPAAGELVVRAPAAAEPVVGAAAVGEPVTEEPVADAAAGSRAPRSATRSREISAVSASESPESPAGPVFSAADDADLPEAVPEPESGSALVSVSAALVAAPSVGTRANALVGASGPPSVASVGSAVFAASVAVGEVGWVPSAAEVGGAAGSSVVRASAGLRTGFLSSFGSDTTTPRSTETCELRRPA